DRFSKLASLLVPIVSIATLAGTLMVQTWQFSVSEKNKREAELNTRWESTVRLVSESAKLTPTVIALQPFLNSPEFGDRARLTVIQLLTNTTDEAFFDSLFDTTFIPGDWNSMSYMIKLDRAIGIKVMKLNSKMVDYETNTYDVRKLTPEEST